MRIVSNNPESCDIFVLGQPKKMSLYARYILEREGVHTLENDYGFATYEIKRGNGASEIHIHDVFVLPEHRKRGLGSFFADQVARIGKEAGCLWIVSFVDPRTRGASASKAAQEKYGFKFQTVVPDGRWAFVKEIK